MTHVAASSPPVRGSIHARHALASTAHEWRELFERRALAPNLAAGLTVTLVALPLNLALAIAAGLPPSAGLISGAVAGIIGALCGGSRYQITGPEIALAPITLEIVARHGLSGLVVATFLAGCMQLVFGLCRVGRLIHAIPVPVVAGFLSAVGLLVLDAQLPRLLGAPAAIGSLVRTPPAQLLAQVDPNAAWLGGALIALLVAAARFNRRIPAPLLALCAAVGGGRAARSRAAHGRAFRGQLSAPHAAAIRRCTAAGNLARGAGAGAARLDRFAVVRGVAGRDGRARAHAHGSGARGTGLREPGECLLRRYAGRGRSGPLRRRLRGGS